MFGSVRLDWTFVVLFDLSENWTFYAGVRSTL